MKIETILNAYRDTYFFLTLEHFKPKNTAMAKRWLRQYHAFRDRIIRMDAEKDAEIAELKGWVENQPPYP